MSPSVCVPDSSAYMSPVPQPFPATGPSFQSNHSSESTATPARGSLGPAGTLKPPRQLLDPQGGPEAAGSRARRAAPSCTDAGRPQHLQLLLFHLKTAWPGGAQGRENRAHLLGFTGHRGFRKPTPLLKRHGDCGQPGAVPSLSSRG